MRKTGRGKGKVKNAIMKMNNIIKDGLYSSSLPIPIPSFVMGLLFVVFLAGCGGGGSTPPDPTDCSTNLETRISSAWSTYTAGNYSASLSAFNTELSCDKATSEQVAHLYTGMGYSYFQLNDLTNAQGSFTSATQKSSTNTDAYAGLAIIADAKDNYTDMISSVLMVESLNPSYTFLYAPPTIRMVDIYVIAARGYLASNDVCSFKKYYDKAKAADPNHVSVKQLTEFYNKYTYPQLCPA